MVQGSDGDIIDYLIETNKAGIVNRKLKIGDRSYRYNEQNPLLKL